MRILFALAGLHRVNRGAEVAFISIANELAKAGDAVTLIGCGASVPGTLYNFIQASCISRDRFRSFPSLPLLRSEYIYEELTFMPKLLYRYRPGAYDVTLTCSYPFTNWLLRRPKLRDRRPPHVFVTENGDWPAISNSAEYRFFGCEGLVCTNPDYYQRNLNRWKCALIPNGVDCERFKVGLTQRQALGLPTDRLAILMVSALIPSKRVEIAVEAVSRIDNAHLVVAGDGPLRQNIENLASCKMPGRFTLLSLPAERMPLLYQSVDVFLHLSKMESFGNVFLEAMACGLPIVAHDSERLRWIVGDDEFLVDTENQNALIFAIECAANAPRERRPDRAARASLFSWAQVGKKYRDFLKEVVDDHKR